MDANIWFQDESAFGISLQSRFSWCQRFQRLHWYLILTGFLQSIFMSSKYILNWWNYIRVNFDARLYIISRTNLDSHRSPHLQSKCDKANATSALLDESSQVNSEKKAQFQVELELMGNSFVILFALWTFSLLSLSSFQQRSHYHHRHQDCHNYLHLRCFATNQSFGQCNAMVGEN